MTFIKAILESPFAGNVSLNKAYAAACMRDMIKNHGEAPFASHMLYTHDGVLDDLVPEERRLGINAGFEWHKVAEKSVVYTDLGITSGMEAGVESAKMAGIEVEYRSLPEHQMRFLIERFPLDRFVKPEI